MSACGVVGSSLGLRVCLQGYKKVLFSPHGEYSQDLLLLPRFFPPSYSTPRPSVT